MPYFFSYLKHLFRSKRRHGVHPPFAYAIGDDVLHQFPIWTYRFGKKSRKRIAAKQLQALKEFLASEPLPGLTLPQIQILEDLNPNQALYPSQSHTATIIVQPYLFDQITAPISTQGQYTIINTWHLLFIINHPAFMQPYYLRMH